MIDNSPLLSVGEQTIDKRFGFSLVDLLMAITVIGILLALLMPGIQASREKNRCSQCASKISALAKGFDGYESAHKKYPPGSTQ